MPVIQGDINMHAYVRIIFTCLFPVFALNACIGSGSDSTDSARTTSGARLINAGGIKGPLAHADLRIYAFDPAFPDMYNPNAPIAVAITDQFAQVSGLSVSGDTAPPYILTIGGSQAIDLDTGMPPVIETLTTVITSKMLAENKTVYATPLTTLAYQMARSAATGRTTAAGFEQSVERAGKRVSTEFALDQQHAIDIFSSPVVINGQTDTLAKQEEAVYHRAALEAFAANVYQMSLVKGNGLQATYFRDPGLSDMALKRVDAGVNFDWGTKAPVQGVGPDGFSVRWSGLVMPDYSENYTFYVSTDNGVRLWVDGQLVIDNWNDQLVKELSATVALEAGKKYPIVMEYYEYIGNASAKLSWSSASEPRQVIPKSNLFNLSDATELAQLTTDRIIRRIGRDLQSDGIINNAAGNADIGGIDPAAFAEDPRGLAIPNTRYRVSDMVALLAAEQAALGSANDAAFLVDGNILASGSGGTPQVKKPEPGTVPNPVVTVQDPPPIADPKPMISASSNRLDFGAIDVGSVSSAATLELTNSGSADMILDISFPPGYTGFDDCNNYLPAGTRCTISISYTPVIPGSANGQLIIAGNAENAPYSIQLGGEGKSVAQPAPVTPSASYFSENFESAGWENNYSTLGNVSRAGGVAARSGSYGLRIDVDKGKHWGGRILYDHSAHGQKGNFREIWARYYVRFGPNWKRNDNRLGKAGYRARSDEVCRAPCLEMTDSHELTSTGAIAGYSYYHRNMKDTDIENRSFGYSRRNWTGGLRQREQWYCIETHHVLNTPGVGNGVYQNWVDGELVSDQKNLRQRDSATFNIDNSVLIAYVGGDWVADRNMTVYFDDWAVSDQRIGCAG